MIMTMYMHEDHLLIWDNIFHFYVIDPIHKGQLCIQKLNDRVLLVV